MTVKSGQSKPKRDRAAYMRDYRRRKREGQDTSRGSVLERITGKVIKDDTTGCWLFQGTKNIKGYGLIWCGEKRQTPVHRVMFREIKGEIPEGLVVHHTCEVKNCVNPEHLALLSNDEHSRLHRIDWLNRRERATA